MTAIIISLGPFYGLVMLALIIGFVLGIVIQRYVLDKKPSTPDVQPPMYTYKEIKREKAIVQNVELTGRFHDAGLMRNKRHKIARSIGAELLRKRLIDITITEIKIEGSPEGFEWIAKVRVIQPVSHEAASGKA